MQARLAVCESLFHQVFSFISTYVSPKSFDRPGLKQSIALKRDPGVPFPRGSVKLTCRRGSLRRPIYNPLWRCLKILLFSFVTRTHWYRRLCWHVPSVIRSRFSQLRAGIFWSSQQLPFALHGPAACQPPPKKLSMSTMCSLHIDWVLTVSRDCRSSTKNNQLCEGEGFRIPSHHLTLPTWSAGAFSRRHSFKHLLLLSPPCSIGCPISAFVCDQFRSLPVHPTTCETSFRFMWSWHLCT